jgi:hypothetical protein
MFPPLQRTQKCLRQGQALSEAEGGWGTLSRDSFRQKGGYPPRPALFFWLMPRYGIINRLPRHTRPYHRANVTVF